MTLSPRRLLPLACAAAALGAAPATAGASIAEFTGLTAGSPVAIAAGADGALWFTEQGTPGGIGRITTDGAITEFPAGTTPGLSAGAQPGDIVQGGDGGLWFTEAAAIGRLDPASGAVTEYAAGLTPGGAPAGIAAGPDGNVWFTERAGAAIGRISPDGTITEFTAGVTPGSEPAGIAAGDDGALWFTERADPGRIGRIDPLTGLVTEYSGALTPAGAPSAIAAGPESGLLVAEPGASRIAQIELDPLAPPEFTEWATGITPGAQPTGIAEGGDGAVWFTEAGSPGRLGRVRSGTIAEYTGGLAAGFTAGNDPAGLTRGPDGNVWFTQRGSLPRIARITVPPRVSTGMPKLADGGGVRIKGDVAPNSQETSYVFNITSDAGYALETSPASVGDGAEEESVDQTLDLPRDAHYEVRLSASNASGDAVSSQKAFYLSADGELLKEKPAVKEPATSTVTVEPSSADPPAVQPAAGTTSLLPPAAPVLGQTVSVAPVTGTVRVKPPGALAYVPLSAGASIRVGSLVDTRHGTVKLRSARDAKGTTQTGRFWGSIFQVRQSHVLTDLVLKGGRFGGCRAAGKASISSATRDAGRSVVRRLWGRDDHGRFRTHGRDSVAAVRGTVWSTTDRCDGTFTRVMQGKVLVRDLHTGRTVLLRAGHRYLARHRP